MMTVAVLDLGCRTYMEQKGPGWNKVRIYVVPVSGEKGKDG